MMPDFNNDGKLSSWEGAAADLWQHGERERAGAGGHRRPERPGNPRPAGPSGCGCGNVTLGCVLIFGFVVVAAVALVAVLNLLAAS